jgi:hypothetical protein
MVRLAYVMMVRSWNPAHRADANSAIQNREVLHWFASFTGI